MKLAVDFNDPVPVDVRAGVIGRAGVIVTSHLLGFVPDHPALVLSCHTAVTRMMTFDHGADIVGGVEQREKVEREDGMPAQKMGRCNLGEELVVRPRVVVGGLYHGQNSVSVEEQLQRKKKE